MYTAVGISRLVYLGFNFGLVQNPQLETQRWKCLCERTAYLNLFIFCNIIHSDVIDVLYNDTFNCWDYVASEMDDWTKGRSEKNRSRDHFDRNKLNVGRPGTDRGPLLFWCCHAFGNRSSELSLTALDVKTANYTANKWSKKAIITLFKDFIDRLSDRSKIDERKPSNKHWWNETKRRRPLCPPKNPRHWKCFLKAQVSARPTSSAFSILMTQPHTLLSQVNPDSAISDPAGMASCVCALETSLKFNDRERRPHITNFNRNSGLDS